MTVMRTDDEIVQAHDVMERELRMNMTLEPELRDLALAGLNVLCWVLGHKEGDKFGRLIAGLQIDEEEAAASAEKVN